MRALPSHIWTKRSSRRARGAPREGIREVKESTLSGRIIGCCITVHDGPPPDSAISVGSA